MVIVYTSSLHISQSLFVYISTKHHTSCKYVLRVTDKRGNMCENVYAHLPKFIQYQDKRILFYWIPSHVGIIGNEKADTAAKAGLSKRVTNVPIPYGDFKKHINILLKRKWQSQWDEAANNKLHEIHPQLGLWPGGSRIIRREESVLARIRIGHTHLTHCFLLKGEDPPQCIACDCESNMFYLSVSILLSPEIDILMKIPSRNSLKRFLQTALYLIYMRLVCFTDCKTFKEFTVSFETICYTEIIF